MDATELRQRVLALQTDRKPVPLDFEPWGEGLYIKVLSAKDQLDLSETVEAKEMPFQVILHCLVDSTGSPVFGEADVASLEQFPFPEVMQVFARVAKLNGMSTKELDEAMQNFAQAPDEQRSIG